MEAFQAGMLLSTMIEAMSVYAEIEAMKAANEFWAHRGYAQSYPEESFKEKANHLWALSNLAREQIK